MEGVIGEKTEEETKEEEGEVEEEGSLGSPMEFVVSLKLEGEVKYSIKLSFAWEEILGRRNVGKDKGEMTDSWIATEAKEKASFVVFLRVSRVSDEFFD